MSPVPIEIERELSLEALGQKGASPGQLSVASEELEQLPPRERETPAGRRA